LGEEEGKKSEMLEERQLECSHQRKETSTNKRKYYTLGETV
jgi:hypothetical protein